jgi:hypothetical protein
VGWEGYRMKKGKTTMEAKGGKRLMGSVERADVCAGARVRVGEGDDGGRCRGVRVR